MRPLAGYSYSLILLAVAFSVAAGCQSSPGSDGAPAATLATAPSPQVAIVATPSSTVAEQSGARTSPPTETAVQAAPAPARPIGPTVTVESSPATATVGGPPMDRRTSSGVEALTTLAKQDLVGRTGVSEAQITVVSATSEEWRDSSLGCPQPGGMYAQVITPGYRIVLEAGGKRYEYHTDSSRVVLCQAQ